MNDDELTKLAVAQLIAEGRRFAKTRELRYTFEEPNRLRPNLKYLKNTLSQCISSNKRLERAIQSASAKRKNEDEKKGRKYKNPELSEHPTYEKGPPKTENLTSKNSETQKSTKSDLCKSDDQKKHSNRVSSPLVKLKKRK